MEPFLETIDLDIEEASELLFKVKVEGVEPSPAKVRLVCESPEVALMFNGHPTQDEGVVQFLLPALKDKLKAGVYQSRVEVLIENRYFAPVQFNLNFKKAVTVVAEAVQVPQRKVVPQISVTAAPVVVKRPTPAAPPAPAPGPRPIVVEEQQKPAPVVPKPVPVAPKPTQKTAPPPARFNAAMTLKERYNSRVDETHEEVIDEVDETNEELLKELARGFIKNKK
jgi:hypothetical protein